MFERAFPISRDDQLMEGGADQECGSIVTIIKETIYSVRWVAKHNMHTIFSMVIDKSYQTPIFFTSPRLFPTILYSHIDSFARLDLGYHATCRDATGRYDVG